MRLDFAAIGLTLGFLLACTGVGDVVVTDAAPATDAAAPVEPEPAPEPASAPIVVGDTTYREADGYMCCSRERSSVGVGLEKQVYTVELAGGCAKDDGSLLAGTNTTWATCEAYFAEPVCCARITPISKTASTRGECRNIALEPTCDRYNILGGKIERAEDTPGVVRPRDDAPAPAPAPAPAGKTGKKAGKNR